MLTVEIREVKYARKESDYSVWVKDGGKNLLCAHPVTDRPMADLVAAAFRTFIEQGGEQQIRDTADLR